jgi:hypothetical protein
MAIIIKRQSVEDFGEDRREVLAEVQQLITGGNMQMVIYMFTNKVHDR